MHSVEHCVAELQCRLCVISKADAAARRHDEGDDYSPESVLSPEASQRITAAACSVAEQVDRAVSLAVQAISPGGRPSSSLSTICVTCLINS